MAISWLKTDHVCRLCFGRIYRSNTPKGSTRVWQCSNCGLESESLSVRSMCACGSTYKRGGNRGLRCQRNPEHRPGINGEIVVVHVEDSQDG